MAGKTRFEGAKNKIVACRIEEDVYQRIKENYGAVSTYIVNLIYGQDEFKDKHPDSIAKKRISEQIELLKKQLKELK